MFNKKNFIEMIGSNVSSIIDINEIVYASIDEESFEVSVHFKPSYFMTRKHKSLEDAMLFYCYLKKYTKTKCWITGD